MICTARWLGYFSLKSTTTYWLGYSMTIRKWSLRGMCIYWLSAVRRRRFLYHERMVLSWCSWSLPICNMLLVLDMTFESSVLPPQQILVAFVPSSFCSCATVLSQVDILCVPFILLLLVTMAQMTAVCFWESSKLSNRLGLKQGSERALRVSPTLPLRWT